MPNEPLVVRGCGNPNCPICNRQPRKGTWEHARWLLQQAKPIQATVVPVEIREIREEEKR